MSDEATEERTRAEKAEAGPHAGEGHGEPDKSAKQTGEQPAPRRAEVSNYEIVEHWFEVAAERLELPDEIAAVLRSSYREVQVQVPVRLPDGKLHVFSGYRVQHNGARGPHKGGVRFHPEVDLDPSGGARASLNVDPGKLEPDELQAVARSFMDRIEKVLGPPAGHPGARRRDQRPGHGLALDPSGATFVMQGFGNVGAWAPRLMQQLGAKMVGVADAEGRRDPERQGRPHRPRRARQRGRRRRLLLRVGPESPALPLG